MPRTIVYTPGAKIIFLINIILIIKRISNKTVGVIISINANSKVEAAFPTKNRIKVNTSDIALL
jgi:hypothetical protein